MTGTNKIQELEAKALRLQQEICRCLVRRKRKARDGNGLC
jgi:hypothetical protein